MVYCTVVHSYERAGIYCIIVEFDNSVRISRLATAERGAWLGRITDSVDEKSDDARSTSKSFLRFFQFGV